MLNTSLNKLQHDTLLERTRVSWFIEGGGSSFIGEGTLEDGDEGAHGSLGGGSQGVSIGFRLSGCRSILLSFTPRAVGAPEYYPGV